MTDFEKAFVEQLLGQDLQAVQPRAFAVYRNTYAKSCVEALEANFPSLVRLLGLDWFQSAALTYARLHPPQEARLFFYGDGHFGSWIQAQAERAAPEQEWRYLSGVARLDELWRQSHAAGDARVPDAAALSDCDPQALVLLVLRPHPAARWVWFEDQPVYSLWSRSREEVAPQFESLHWQGEGVLITRPGAHVQWQALSRVGCLLLDACARESNWAAAAASVLAADPDADLASLIKQVLLAGALAQVVV
jgi:hypothetical protein